MRLSEKIFHNWNTGEPTGLPTEWSKEAAALEALVPFLVHAYLECAESAHEDCPCGLDELTDAAHLPRCDAYPL